MQHLITVCGYIFITSAIFTILMFVIIYCHNEYKIRKDAERAKKEDAGEQFLQQVKAHLKQLERKSINK